jgi:hypothetical protein
MNNYILNDAYINLISVGDQKAPIFENNKEATKIDNHYSLILQCDIISRVDSKTVVSSS